MEQLDFVTCSFPHCYLNLESVRVCWLRVTAENRGVRFVHNSLEKHT